MRHIYLSFLGLGTFNRETGKFGYIETVYELEGKASERDPAGPGGGNRASSARPDSTPS